MNTEEIKLELFRKIDSACAKTNVSDAKTPDKSPKLEPEDAP